MSSKAERERERERERESKNIPQGRVKNPPARANIAMRDWGGGGEFVDKKRIS